jgi:hypothetical protein
VTTSRKRNLGCPREFYSLKRRDTVSICFVILLFGGCAIFTVFNLVPGVERFFQGLGIILCIWIIFSWIKFIIVTWREGARLYPYYNAPLPRAGTYWSGQALLRNLVYLDRLAEKKGIKSLSSYGFPDGYKGETVVWHDAAEGIQTVEGLRIAVSEEPEAVDDADRVISDLERVYNALERARGRAIRFAFLLEYPHGDNTISWQMRWKAREGYISDGNPWPPKRDTV